jgi:hypothetical protein
VRAAVGALVLGAVLLAGCAGHDGEQAVSIYFWNESDREFGYAPDPQTDPPDFGSIPLGMVTIGCAWMPEGWTVQVFEAPVTPTSTGNAVAQVVGDDFPGPEADVWIRVTKGGTVLTGSGVPVWWQQDRQQCGV